MPQNLREALVDEVRDMYNAEKQIVKALPKIIKAVSADELRDALESHLEETHGQVSRLERVFEMLDEKPRGKHCAGMAGILEEGSDKLEEDAEPAVMDASLIAASQRVEHYEITAYGTMIAWAEALDLTDVAQLLEESLAEEKAADEKLSAIAESGINEAATAGESDDMEEDDEEEEETEAMPSRSAAKPQPAAASARSARARGGRR
ncbi:MAG TPA: ferritin-like domain-containing protein [Vicinamibacterales bacterium]|jgi:ferritin-like metal-binding protein YciE